MNLLTRIRYRYRCSVSRFTRRVLLSITLPFLLFVSASGGLAFAKIPAQPQMLSSAAFAVPNKYSADAAERILQQGGNAVDAAVAVAFTLAVTYPEAGNIGGGGFMTLYINGKPYFLDYRERAPLAATEHMYLNNRSEIIKGMSLYGPRAVAVPGTVAGMWAVHQRFGKLKWQQVLAPAIQYAQSGFIVDAQLQKRRDQAAHAFAEIAEKSEAFGLNFNTYFGNLKKGVNFKQPALAATLQRIAQDGPKDFYDGKTAQLIVAEMRGKGLMTKRDLHQYKAVWRQPIVANWNGYQIITAPPPSSGGIGLVQLLKIKALLKHDFDHVALNSAQYIHLIAEIEKRVFADRAQYLGDPDFYKVPVAQLISDAYLRRRAAEIKPTSLSDTDHIRPGLGISMNLKSFHLQPQKRDDKTPVTPIHAVVSESSLMRGLMPELEKAETTHFSVIDKAGNAVSNTYTLNGDFGSGVVVSGAGIVLNDEMDDFSAKPGIANMFGVVGSNANGIAPGKRPLSSMSPTILTKGGNVALVIGTPGGSRIFTSVFQVINNLYDFNLPLQQAVAAMRFHHQLLPKDTLFSEPYRPIQRPLAQQLEAKGYKLQQQEFNGDIQAIRIDGDRPEPAADPRGRGVARTVQVSEYK